MTTVTIQRTPGCHFLSRNESLNLLALEQVGRIGISIGALPAVLPVNFALDHGYIVIRTVRGSKLDAAVASSVVAFEVDHFDEDGRSGWSVMVQGRSAEVEDQADLARVRELPLRSWALGDAADRYVQIEMAKVSGLRFSWRY